MAELTIQDRILTVELSTMEKIGALRRSNPSFPLDSVVSVRRLENSRKGIRGIRAPGTGWPGRIALGSWRTLHSVDFVAVYRNRPGYVIELHDQSVDRLVVSSPEIDQLELLANTP